MLNDTNGMVKRGGLVDRPNNICRYLARANIRRNEMKYVIEEKLANTILNYLIKKPYVEVKYMADGLQALPTLQEELEKIKNSSELHQLPQND